MRAKIGRREKNVGRAERRTRRIAAFADGKSISGAKEKIRRITFGKIVALCFATAISCGLIPSVRKTAVFLFKKGKNRLKSLDKSRSNILI